MGLGILKTAAGNIKIEGADELRKALETLPIELQKKVLRKALRRGARPIRDETKRTAPKDTGLLRRSFTVRALKTRSSGLVGVKITTAGKAPHAHLVELGTQERTQKTTGRRTGRISPGLHFMAKAAETKKDEAVRILSEEIRVGVEREAKRGG